MSTHVGDRYLASQQGTSHLSNLGPHFRSSFIAQKESSSSFPVESASTWLVPDFMGQSRIEQGTLSSPLIPISFQYLINLKRIDPSGLLQWWERRQVMWYKGGLCGSLASKYLSQQGGVPTVPTLKRDVQEPIPSGAQGNMQCQG